jgi:hypothetical protein
MGAWAPGAALGPGAPPAPAARRGPRALRAPLALAAAAALAALLAGYSVSLAPPGLRPRGLEYAAASAKLLVDGSASELTGPAPAGAYQSNLAGKLAVGYALYLQSEAATAALARAVTGRAGVRVAASGPFTLLLGRENRVRAGPASVAPLPVDGAYRLVLDVDGASPVLSIYAQAPTTARAVALVEAARTLLARHVAAQESAYPLGPEVAVVLRPLGRAQGGIVDGGARAQLMGLAAGLVLLAGGALALARRRRWRGRALRRLSREPRAAAQLDPARRPAAAVRAGDDWPHTTRLLPWALAGFLAMLFLVPFDSIDLPVSLPLNGSLDRLALLGLALLWLCAFLARRRAARPRLTLTPVHFAAGAFLAVCCLGAALDGHALASMGEVTLVVKKLALLASYVVFFAIVASTLRPGEVGRFAATIVVLGAILAVATVVEYRTHYDVFYALWGKVVSLNVPSDLDTPDSIGRLTVYGPTSQPLELAALLAMVLPFAAVGAIDAPGRGRRLLYAVAIGLLLAGGVATSRKTSLVAPAAGVAVLAAYRPRAVLHRLGGLAVALVALVHVTSPGALGSVVEQLEPGHVNGVLTTTDRTARYAAVVPDVLRHVLLGRGFQSYDPHKYRILDNEYLGLLITTGGLGVLAFVGVLGAMVWVGDGVVRGRGLGEPAGREGHVRASLALAGVASLGVIVVAGALFDVLAFPHVPYLVFFVGGALVALRAGGRRGRVGAGVAADGGVDAGRDGTAEGCGAASAQPGRLWAGPAVG